MIYLYAYTNHRADLDHLRRMGALWRALERRGVPAEIIVNDYRAQLAGRELGLPLATTVENIMELDALVTRGDTLVIDSPEEAGERLGYYVEKYREVWRVSECGEAPRYGEKILEAWKEGAVVDPLYAEGVGEKAARRVLIYGDTDQDRRLLEAAPDLAVLDLELYWGIYFYVKYEEELAKHFRVIHEDEEYAELIQSSETVITAMPQTAAEAAAAGARVVWLDRGENAACVSDTLREAGVRGLPWGAWEELGAALKDLSPVDGVDNRVEKWAELLSTR
ncbi:hypothetical protein [Nitratifractor salsuginis]|uniref:Uncharacterized protein n=1 Tax=Nitratifractor salsuginis (strain DSM 16511 / JCM 12458 / E9I37-1) TaxID=749222 RepID=E6X240_NITSE|nr:hypothetical protein [Nitratifractor salsuginis]ADV47109.1 hypothetical protein Nitsa_1864 [Nitratifractor salsuginis DSM 16511]